MSTTLNRSFAVATGAVLVVGLSACGGSNSVKKDDVAKQITDKVSSQTNMKIKDAKCDDDLKAEVGATTKCEAKVDGSKQKFVAKVKSVEGKTVNFTISKG